MKSKTTLLLAAFVLAASFGCAQNAVQTANDSAVYRVKANTEPTIHISNGITGGKQDKEILLENPFMSVTGEWTIVSYKVTFVRVINGNGKEDPPIMVKGARFSDEVISKIQSAPSGTNLEFSDIKIQSKSAIRTIPTVLMVRIQ